VQAKVQVNPVSVRGDTQRAGDRHFLVRPGALIQDRRVTSRRSGAPYQGRHQQPRLVGECQPGLQSRSVFLPRASRS
jgi:hypothetical protein